MGVKLTGVVLLLLLCGCAALPPKPPPANPPGTSSAARHTLDLAIYFYKHQLYADARRELTRYIVYYPTASQRELAHYLIGETFFGEQSYRDAASAFEEYLRNFPDGPRFDQARRRIDDCVAGLENYRLAELPVVKLTPPLPSGQTAGPGQVLHQVRATWYWIEEEEKYDDSQFTDLLDSRGNFIGTVPRNFYRRLVIEGTGRLRDGRLINWVGRGRFLVLGPDHPFGMGARNLPLIPLRSIAVDPRRIPLGTPVYIAAFDGLHLPGGKRHDGCFVAHDVGSAIQGRHIDIFMHQETLARQLISRIPEWLELTVGGNRCPTRYPTEDYWFGHLFVK